MKEPPAEPLPAAAEGEIPFSPEKVWRAPGRQSPVQTGQDPELLRRLLRAKDRMDAASHEEWPVRRLARVSCVSQAHFARSFKEAFGVPPHRYLLTRRIERAKALLRDTDLPVTDIAFDTGWQSLGTFGRVFRDITGESPNALRAREKAARHELELVPHCYVSAAYRPDLTIAVSEKRRLEAGDTHGTEDKTEVPKEIP
jgi:AraC-like DNA-binding protein